MNVLLVMDSGRPCLNLERWVLRVPDWWRKQPLDVGVSMRFDRESYRATDSGPFLDKKALLCVLFFLN